MVFQKINRLIGKSTAKRPWLHWGEGEAASLVPMQTRSSDKSKMAVNLYSLIKKNFIV